MAGRRKVVDENVHHERWLVSYADFVTLLFAFFVVMYSISQVNESKYRVLSDTLTDAFNQNEERTLDPIQIGQQARSNPLNLIELDAVVEQHDEGDVARDDGGEVSEPYQKISDYVEEAFGELLDAELINLRGNEEWLEIELNSSLLFGSGDARLTVPAMELLSGIIRLIEQHTHPVRVEGFTDDRPIKTLQFPSNWELSAARAAAVVQLFIEEGVDPSRLAAAGYGQYQPVADNSSADGREKNRRVVLLISKTGELRPVLEPVLRQARQQEPVAGELDGVQTIQLEGGGLLFTSEPAVTEPAAPPKE